MKTKQTTLTGGPSRPATALFLSLLMAAALRAQTAPAPAPADAGAPPASVPTPAQVNPNPSAPAASAPVKLNPFEVQSDRDNGYTALNSNSVTGFSAELDKLPLSADIMNQQLMSDLGVTTIEDAIRYSAGAGYAGADPSTTAGNQPGDINSNSYIQLRGLQTPTMERDGFMQVGAYGNPGSTGIGYTSNFDVDRLELINGPQGLLYGGGGGGGIINMVSKQARIGSPDFGSINFLNDQYGTKRGIIDYGVSDGPVAFRLALMDGNQNYQRINIGGQQDGEYAQLAFKLGPQTTIRITGERTDYQRSAQNSPSINTDNASGAPFDRNGYNIYYLLAANEAGANDPVTGAAFPSGALDNGKINLANVDSYGGWWVGDNTTNAFGELTAESEWSSWFSSFVGLGYDNYKDQRPFATPSIFAPLSTSNPDPGIWSESLSPSVTDSPTRTKVIRASGLVTNDLFGGSVHSQTLFGVDFSRSDFHQDTYGWYQADANFNPVLTGTASTNFRVALPTQTFSIQNGPIFDALFSPYQTDVTVGGVNYVKMIANQVNPSLISPLDPTGATLGGSTYQVTKLFNKGLYAMNYSQWFDGKLDTLAGARYANTYDEALTAGNALSATILSPHDDLLAVNKVLSFNLGADYSVNQWIHPYVSFSNSYQPPPVSAADAYGNPPKTAHGIGEEAGLKFDNASKTLSATLSFYDDNSKNEEYLMNGTLLNDISPKGISTGGSHFNGGNQWEDVDRTSEGITLALTAAPTANWRMRLSASDLNGTIHNTVEFQQLYDDGFYTNTNGQVTFSDGTVVWVPSTPNAKAPVVLPGTAGAAPLTLAMINSPSSPYYAFTAGTVPVAIQVTNTNLTTVLKAAPPTGSTAPAGATIYTGIGGINYQQAQILPAFAAGGFAVPGTVVAAAAGDKTAGYPVYSMDFTNVYTFSSGFLKGFEVGGTEILGWQNRGYYYFPAGVSLTAPRSLYMLPNTSAFNAIIAYRHRFGRFVWSTQLNIDNLFNHYGVFFEPSENTGWSTPSAITASIFGQPRFFQWTTSLAF